jgi:hypothetical protein
VITVSRVKGCTASELHKLHTAIGLANLVWISPEFKREIELHTFAGIFGFASTEDKNEEVYRKLMFVELKIKFSVETPPWYKRFTSEVAREVDGEVIFNRLKFKGMDNASLCNTVVHEATHVAGYSHDWKRTYRREYSVPYAVGAIAEKLARKLIAAKPEWRD